MISRKSEGLLFRYAPEDKDGGAQSHYSSMGVSGLLGGQGGALIPVGNRCMARREEHEADSLSHRGRAGVGAAEVSVDGEGSNGHHNGNGHAKGNGKAHKNGHAKLNGNGNGNGHPLSLRERAGVREDSDAAPFATRPIIDRLS